jgi:hypothetical protein
MSKLILTIIAALALSVGPAAAQYNPSPQQSKGLGQKLYGRSFQGYPCTEDCSGHEAGYDWAYEKGIDDPDDCGGYSQSFIEGCYAAAEEQYQEEYDGGMGTYW